MIVYVHPGGYVAGEPRYCHQIASRLCGITGLDVLVPRYRLAPEHPFPAGRDDVVAATLRLLDEVPAGRIAIGGASAGAGLALSALLRLRDLEQAIPSSVFLASPWVDLTGDLVAAQLRDDEAASNDPDFVGSRSQLAAYMRECAQMYRGTTPADAHGVSPIRADLFGLPPVHIEVSRSELLVGDARMLASRWRAAGSRATLHEAHSARHAYLQNDIGSTDGHAALYRVATHVTCNILDSGTL